MNTQDILNFVLYKMKPELINRIRKFINNFDLKLVDPIFTICKFSGIVGDNSKNLIEPCNYQNLGSTVNKSKP